MIMYEREVLSDPQSTSLILQVEKTEAQRGLVTHIRSQWLWIELGLLPLVLGRTFPTASHFTHTVTKIV